MRHPEARNNACEGKELGFKRIELIFRRNYKAEFWSPLR